ncbi:universal stress protein [Actinosynnema sp. NPDC049800]
MAGPVVVGVDGSSAALTAVKWAADESVRRHVGLRLVHGYLPPIHGYPELVLAENEVRRVFQLRAEQCLEEAAAAARATVPDVHVEWEAVGAGPSEALIDQSRRASLLVVGSEGRGGVAGLLVGSVAVALVAHGRCPVVVVRHAEALNGPVVVGVDGSPVSERAIAFAFEEASLRAAPLTAVIACDDFVYDTPEGSLRLVSDWDAVQAEQRRALAERLAGWQEKHPDVTVEREVVRSRPTRALLDAGRGAQLLVVGSHGRGGFTGMLLGSTSQALIHHAPCPLAVVRRTEAER